MSDVFEVEATSREPFRFRLPGEKKIRELQHLDTMPIGIKQQLASAAAPMQRAKKAGRTPTEAQASHVGEAIIRLFEFACPGITDQVDADQLAALLKGWEQHSGIKSGESSASAGS